ncbi:sensor histidine kinase [Citricoccus muralis]|uniref:histidine kinase n=1 Tax=Citricoccus muralis TaxID=169134 RepID=A0ABY8H731_9MICC|nr:sensor histidine kinase [Citricoccus muralis]WFP16736.1 sensor histidine kinase [Citricoccus muralis]
MNTTTTPPRPHFLVGAASVLLSGLLSVTWLIVSVSIFFTGIGSLPAGLMGVLLLVPWVMVMRWIARLERRRALAVHGIDTIEPARTVSDKPGFLGWLHTLGLTVISWPFWRSVLHHHLNMFIAFFPSLVFYSGIWALWTSIEASIVVPDARVLAWQPGPFLMILGGALWFVAGLAALTAGIFAERGLARVMLPNGDEALREEVHELTARRQGAVDAAEQERMRIERDLHDGIQPRLVSLAMTLGLAKTKMDQDLDSAKHLVDEAHTEAKAVITDLRQLARGIHPAVLSDRGLDAALSSLAARSPIPVDLNVSVPGRLPREQEAVAYFVIAETLTNITKHSHASRATVLVTVEHDQLYLRVEDDGRGGAMVRRDGVSTGLAGLSDRVRATGGSFEIASPVGGPTVITAHVPLTTQAQHQPSQTSEEQS